jgi:hypothetical protein
VKSNPGTADQQLQIWQAIKRGGHPNLLPIWGTGRAQIDGHDVIYVVVQPPDEKLATVLRERPLEPAEAGEILVSMVGALGHLHAHRLVHGNVSPEQILGVGETVKLSTESVHKAGSPALIEGDAAKYRAPESADGNVTPAADIWSLGATLVEVLTQQPPLEEPLEAAARLPAPFDKVAQSCLRPEPEARGTLTQILDLYDGRVAPVPRNGAGAASRPSTEATGDVAASSDSREPVSEEQATAAVASGPSSIESTRVVREPNIPEAEPSDASLSQEAPSGAESGNLNEQPMSPPRRPDPPDAAQETMARAKRRAWAFVAIALVVMLGVVWLLRPRSTRQDDTHPGASVPERTSEKRGQTMTLPAAGQNGAPVTPSVAKKPDAAAEATATAPVERPPRTKGTPASSPAGRGPIWRVILYTYNREADAERRVAMINRNHPDLHAEVFAPKGDGQPPFLVAIGGAMDRDQALRVRGEALRVGLPHDAYLQNYSR